MQEEKIELRTEDAFILSAIHIRPQSCRGAVQINAATGTKKEFYLNFARYLSDNGFAVLLYDYRGIGESAPPSLRGFQANLRDWGSKDMPAAFAWLRKQHPDQPAFILGHSMGGQLIGLMHNAPQAEGIILAGSSVGYWPLLPFPSNIFYWTLWHILQPPITRTLGYLPAGRLGLGEDIPGGVAEEFRQWCTSPGYFADFFGKTIHHHYYSQIGVPLLSLVPTDDNIAGRRSVPPLLSLYSRASVTQQWIRPEDIGEKKIGHFGLFSRRYKLHLWPLMLDFLEKQLENAVTDRP
jgi:predicted alpha/beta hydrolase